MPAPGDQHKLNGATTTNPFDEHKPHISEYTAQEIATLQSRLNKRLGPEFLSTRPGPGNQKIPYLSAEKAINLANEVFGFNGWSTSIQNIQIDFVDENAQTGKVSIGLSVVLRVTLRDGTYHEDIGYGGIENCKGKAMAFEKSKKEATTDALKRALRNFGNVLGNCVYDKDYVTKVSKIKAGNGRFDVNELHRHPDYMPKTIEDVKATVSDDSVLTGGHSLVPEDSFDASEFDDFDFNDNDLSHSDEILLPSDLGPSKPQTITRPSVTNISTPSKPPQARPQSIQPTGHPRLPGQQPGDHFGFQQGQNGLPPEAPMAPPAGFYSARAAKNVDLNDLPTLPTNAAKFNPHAESPSIRKTAGVDHSKSVPVKKDIQKVESNTLPNVVDPRGDTSRRIAAPGHPMPGPISRPGMSTSAYRPPTRHGSPAVPAPNAGTAGIANTDRVFPAAKRPPLNDLSNVQHNVTSTTIDGADAKRQKTGAGGVISGHVENIANANGGAG